MLLYLNDLLLGMDCSIETINNTDLKINTSNLKEGNMNSDLIRKMRASFLIMSQCFQDLENVKFQCQEDVILVVDQ